MAAPTPPRDDSETTRRGRWCAGCGQMFSPTGQQLHCSPACRKRVFRARHGTDLVVDMLAVAPGATRREHTVYECPDCGGRQLGMQRCQDCGLFGRAVGLGGQCPGCGEPVTVDDLDLTPGTTR